MGESNWCLNCCSFILALVLPPLGVAMKFGCGKYLCICILLCICGWIPGVIFGVIATCCLSVEHPRDGVNVNVNVAAPQTSVVVPQPPAQLQVVDPQWYTPAQGALQQQPYQGVLHQQQGILQKEQFRSTTGPGVQQQPYPPAPYSNMSLPGAPPAPNELPPAYTKEW